ncbi:MAG TPA: PKD domain-containing protein, partial [Chryseolinea sp.]|nr:PKD domain-containing protein [Chryseolinea sp.]
MVTRDLSMKMLNAKLLHSILLLLIALPSISLAQSNSGYNWYFGNSASGIRFSRSDNSPTLVGDQATPFGIGGSAVANDPISGNLLFYTDGLTIYDISHAPMPNGTGLGANASGNQPVAVAKVPGQDNQYYVFSNTADFTTGGSISYRIVDMSLPGNSGAATAPPQGEATSGANTPIAGLTGRSESMIIIGHSNGDDFWLITHANGAADYSVTLFTPTGPTTTTTFSGLGLIEVAANFSYHPGSGKIAVSPQEATRDVEILDFDPATGALTFQQRILNSGVASTTDQAIFDTEWSHNGQYLYISRNGEPGIPADVLQFDLNNPGTTLASILPQPMLPNQPVGQQAITESYGLQMGPDSVIYHIYQTGAGAFYLGQISDTDSVSNLVQYTAQAFPGFPNFNGTQFSSFAPPDTVNLNVTFIPQGLCANAPTSFFPTVTPAADSLRWDFGDGSGSSDWSPVYTYEEGGPYNVSVIAYLNGQTDTTTQAINITEFDTQISLVQDTTGCSKDFPFPKDKTVAGCTTGCFTVTAQVNGSGNPTLQWFGPSGELAGETTNTLAPDSAGYYYLVATDAASGCQTYAGVNIKEYLIQDQRANIWYFGNQAGLDFNPLPENPVAPITNGVMNAPAGTATISDRNGQVIFYTDGESVWNRANVQIATGIGGDQNSSQSAIIMPVPGDETLYYIFTTQDIYGDGTYELRYSLFDLKLNGGSGGIVEQNVLLFSNSTERITGNANWLIAHEYGNNSFRAYQITSLGIGNPVISSIGSNHSFTSAQNGQGYMKLGSQNRLAVALSNPTVSNVIEIFDFADSTGQVTNFRTADLNNPNGQVYGVEFSPSGNKLFATLQGAGTSQLVEFAFDTLAMPYLKKPPIAPVSETLGAIQTGPDGQLYVAVDGQQFLGTIQVNEDTTQVSTFTLNGSALLGGTSSTVGLPNFIQTLSDPIQSPGLTFTGVCIGDSTMFSASGKDSSIDKFDWTFGDGQIAIDGGPQLAHLYAVAGTYTVRVRVYNNCESYDLPPQQVTINGLPPDPSQAVDLCASSGPSELNATYNHPEFSYLWSTGDTTETIMVNRSGRYMVSITNAAGCTTDAQFDAIDNRPILNLGPNITICENTLIAPLDAQNPAIGNTYAWT